MLRTAARKLTAGALAAATISLVASPHAGAADKRYVDEIFNKVKVTEDLVYGNAPVDGQPQDLLLDLYQPKGDDVKKRPAIVYVHGGSFFFGDKQGGVDDELARLFAQKGYVTVSINYRILVDGPCSAEAGITAECYNAAIEDAHDAQAAVRWLRANSKSLKVDKKRIAISGTSAGAIIASGVAAIEEDPGASGNPGESSDVGAFISISGGLPGAIFVDDLTAPGLLFASIDDPVVPYQWSVDTALKLQELGTTTNLFSYPGDVHVPYAQNAQEIQDESTKFLFKNLELRKAQTG